VLIEEGYAALSIRRIAARAGVRLGHLQYYYPSKADIVRALLERHLESAIEAVESSVTEAAGKASEPAATTGIATAATSPPTGGIATATMATPLEPGAMTGADRLDRMLAALLHRQEDAEACRLFLELRALAARDAEVAEAASRFYTRYWKAVVAVLLAVSPSLGRPRAERRAALVVALLEGLLLFRSPRDPRRLPLLGLERELRELVATLARP
jgi:AcrR family transcriptional regulator